MQEKDTSVDEEVAVIIFFSVWSSAFGITAPAVLYAPRSCGYQYLKGLEVGWEEEVFHLWLHPPEYRCESVPLPSSPP